MHSREELVFAQMFPFSNKAKELIRKEKFLVEDVSDEILDRAKVMLLNSFKGKDYFMKEVSFSTELMLNEIYAFPTAKILLSLINSPSLNRKFSLMWSSSAFKFLEKEENNDKLFQLFDDFGLKFSFPEKKDFLLSINLMDFLSMPFFNDLKLVNQQVSKGKVFLTRNEAIRFISTMVYNKIFFSLPLKVKVSKRFRESAFLLKSEFYSLRKTLPEFKFSALKPSLFPACMSFLYEKLSSGSKLTHIGNFDLACFLINARISKEDFLKLYSRAPNYKEKIVLYHYNNIKGKESRPRYSSPLCSKVMEHGLCLRNDSCEGIKSPLGYYIRNLKNLKKEHLQETESK
jgi:DNA primase large subunit